MIVRTWRGSATGPGAAAYERHFKDRVVPQLANLAGNRGAWLLRREERGRTELVAITLWQSREAIRAFAGSDIAKAHVEPEARTMLAAFDEIACHYEIVLKIERPA